MEFSEGLPGSKAPIFLPHIIPLIKECSEGSGKCSGKGRYRHLLVKLMWFQVKRELPCIVFVFSVSLVRVCSMHEQINWSRNLFI